MREPMNFKNMAATINQWVALILVYTTFFATLPVTSLAEDKKATRRAPLPFVVPTNDAQPAGQSAPVIKPSNKKGKDRPQRVNYLKPSPINLAAAAALPRPQNASGITVHVGYADSSSTTPNFPYPWKGAPNTVFVGSDGDYKGGAIRIDNNSGVDITIDKVVVDMRRPGPKFDLWQPFTIPAFGSAILTQTEAFNFAANDYPLVKCGEALAENDARVPTITLSVSGYDYKFLDSAHVLDTGGFNSECHGNESLQWRPVGTTGIEKSHGEIIFVDEFADARAGSLHTARVKVVDAAGQPLANTAVAVQVMSGPHQGRSAQVITDRQGIAEFNYIGRLSGSDILQASLKNFTGLALRSDEAIVNWRALAGSDDIIEPLTAITEACPTLPPTVPGTTDLIYLGPTLGEYSDPLPLGALLTDGNGLPLAGRNITFTLGIQTATAVTNGSGVARTTITPEGNPGPIPLTIDFAGDASNSAQKINTTVNIDRDGSRLRYLGGSLLATGAPQQVSAQLFDGEGQTALANKTLNWL